MSKTYLCILTCFFLFGCEPGEIGKNNRGKTTFKTIKVIYPETYKDTNIVDDYHGLKVKDPYRWLEEDDASATQQWVSAQNSITGKYLAQIPYRDAIKERLKAMWNYERYSVPAKKGDNFYLLKNDGLQNQDILYRFKTLQSKPEVVLDPNTFSEDGTASLATYSLSKDGSLLAYQVSEGGSDWRTIRIKDLESGTVLSDEVKWVKFSGISWYRDGFFYSRYDAPNEKKKLSNKNIFHQVYYHKVGTDQEDDELIFADRSHAQRNFSANTTSDESYLILSITTSTSGNALYFRGLDSESYDFTPIVEDFNNDFVIVDNVGDKLLVLTNYKAPNQRLIQISTSKPGEGYWEEVIPESDDVLQDIQLVGGKIVATYIHNASSQIRVFDLDGKPVKNVRLPEIGTVTDLKGHKDDYKAYFSFTSFTNPTTIYELNIASLNIDPVFIPEINFNADAYETRQVWYKSYDGTRIPMFIIHKKGLRMDSNRPTLLYGYGGFDIPMLPIFNRTRLNLFPIILENDGICAVANIRGGGEFGKEWHKAGTKGNKHNVFNDFQAAAEYLISNQYTSRDKLAIYGRSNGGLLVGACMTQRPDLYKVALPAVGVMDMLRYHKFTIGWAWATDYGRSDKSSEFDDLYSYSPVHNVIPQNYPATLVTTADHDDRVVPAHSYKFISELQDKQTGTLPVLIRIDASSGHGAGKPTIKKIDEAADILSFMFFNMKEDLIYSY